MNVFLLVECKSFKININKNAFKQISVYNKVYKSNNIMITNGLTHYLCEYNDLILFRWGFNHREKVFNTKRAGHMDLESSYLVSKLS